MTWGYIDEVGGMSFIRARKLAVLQDIIDSKHQIDISDTHMGEGINHVVCLGKQLFSGLTKQINAMKKGKLAHAYI